MLELTSKDYDALRRHGEETYPHECCGILLGHVDDDGIRVTSITRCGNTCTDSSHNRYNIDLKELVRIQREGRQRGEDIVGFYHSHPDHSAQWSKTDLAEAHWFGCSYVITSVEKGKAALTKAFQLSGSDESDKSLVDEDIAYCSSGSSANSLSLFSRAGVGDWMTIMPAWISGWNIFTLRSEPKAFALNTPLSEPLIVL